MPRYLRVLLGYTVMALVLTWPMAIRFATHVPGDGIDDPSLAWNLWWIKHALIDQPQNPFFSSWQFWPIGINLAFYTLTVLNGLLATPVQLVFGVVPAYNMQLLLSFVLGALGAYLLARQFLKAATGQHAAELAAFTAGAFYAFASSKIFYAALGQGNIASSQWAPFAALYIWRAARPSGRAHDAVLAGLFLVLQAYAELTYASFLLIFAALAIVWALVAQRDRKQGVRRGDSPDSSVSAMLRSGVPDTELVRDGVQGITLLPFVVRFAGTAAIFALGIAPVLANMLPDLRAEGDFFTSGGGFADIFSADLAGYLVPTQLHPALGGVIRAWSHNSAPQPNGSYFAVDKGQHIYLGYAAVALAVAGFWRGRRRPDTWLWGTAVVLFFLLTLGPSLRVAGYDTGIPLPFRLVEVLPFFKGNRYPSRYSVMLLQSLAPLVAAGSYTLLSSYIHRSRHTLPQTRPEQKGTLRWSLVALLLALMLFEHLSIPLPTFDLRVPALYDQVAQEPGDFALLELPLGWRNGARVAGKQDVLIMQQLWYQVSHGKRVLGGNTSRNPEYKFQYFSEQPTLSRLVALTNAADLPQHSALRTALSQQPVTDADREAARRWAAFTNIRYVMIHRDKLPVEAEALAKDLLPLRPVAEEGALALYRLDPNDLGAAPVVYRLASDPDRMALGEGWSSVAPRGTGVDAQGNALGLTAQRSEVRLLLPLGAHASVLRLHAAAFGPDQRVRVAVDHQDVADSSLPMQPGWLEFPIPARAGRPPLSDVRLRFDRTIDAGELGQRLSDAGPLGLLVRSAGYEAGDFARIHLDGREVWSGRRGYNLVALDAAGRFIEAASFDTNSDPEASRRLAEWLRVLAPGTVVAGAVRDEASTNLGPEAVEALARLGLAVDLRGHFRWGHAFITSIGAERSWAPTVEAVDAARPVQLSVGFPLTEPQLAAQVFEIQIVK